MVTRQGVTSTAGPPAPPPGGVTFMTFTPAGDGVTIWDTRIFEQLGGDLFRLHHEIIPELAVPLATIRAALAPDFELLDERDLDGGSVSDESERVFFAYRRR